MMEDTARERDPKRPVREWQAIVTGQLVVHSLRSGECHTARNFLGGLKRDRALAGTAKGPEGDRIPNLTPAKLKKWTDADLKGFLQTGLTPDGDVAAETMSEVIRNTTAQLSPEDLAAMIAYLRSLPAIADEPD